MAVVPQRTRAANIRAMLKFWGINRDADKLEKPPEVCFNDFFESINSTNLLKVQLKGYGMKDLTSGSAADLLSITLAALTGVSFLVRATVIAINATDIQAFSELIQVTAVNKAGTVTTTATNLSTTGSKAVSTGTLTTSYALTTVGTGVEKLQVTATSNITPTSLKCYFTVENVFPANATPPAFL